MKWSISARLRYPGVVERREPGDDRDEWVRRFSMRCDVVVLSGRERWRAGASESEATHEILFRAAAVPSSETSVDPEVDRVACLGRRFELESALYDERARVWRCRAIERVNGGA